MSVNSILSPESEKNAAAFHGYHDFVLIKESAVSRIYRVSKAGKYFIFKSAKDASGRMEALIRREYDLSINLNHPHIVNVFTFEDESEVGPGIVMEYVDGRDLSEFLSEGPSMKLRRRVLDQLLEAVAYLHRKGIVHNDLKPENILITRSDNTVKLLDLGLSDNDAWFLAKMMGCTPEYASPELLHQEKIDSRSDIYSLGLLIGKILDGKNPGIVRKCLSPDKNRRYDNVEQVQKALAHRNYPLYIVSALAIILLILFIGLKSIDGVREFNSFQAVGKQRQELCDSVYKAIDNELSQRYSRLEELISEIPYREFAYLEINRTMSGFSEIMESIQTVTEDQTLISSFISHFNLARDDGYQKILNKVEGIPLLSESSLSPEEFEFYALLLSREEPYKPYQK